MPLGAALASLCKKNNVTFIVNDDPLLAVELEADGVHMGQEDIRQFPIEKVRNIVGRNRIIGLSTHSSEQFRQGSEMDVDYLAFGPVFPTLTKNYSIGTADIREVNRIARKPVVFIGGVNTENLDALLKEGATNIALIRDIMQADDITARTRWYKDKMKAARGWKDGYKNQREKRDPA